MALMRWRYQLSECVTYYHPMLAGCQPQTLYDSGSQRGLVDQSGNLTIFPRYAWDGCSPTVNVLDQVWLGVPDGVIDGSGKPATWRASLVHDFCLQFRDQLCLSPDHCHEIMFDVMIEDGFKMAHAYYWAVKSYWAIRPYLPRNLLKNSH